MELKSSDYLAMRSGLGEILKEFHKTKAYINDKSKEEEFDKILALMDRCVKMYDEEITKEERGKKLYDAVSYIFCKYEGGIN